MSPRKFLFPLDGPGVSDTKLSQPICRRAVGLPRRDRTPASAGSIIMFTHTWKLQPPRKPEPNAPVCRVDTGRKKRKVIVGATLHALSNGLLPGTTSYQPSVANKPWSAVPGMPSMACTPRVEGKAASTVSVLTSVRAMHLPNELSVPLDSEPQWNSAHALMVQEMARRRLDMWRREWAMPVECNAEPLALMDHSEALAEDHSEATASEAESSPRGKPRHLVYTPIFCSCGVGGLAEETRRDAYIPKTPLIHTSRMYAPFAGQPARPQGLKCFSLQGRPILDRIKSYVNSIRPDMDQVRHQGTYGTYIPLLESEHPSAHRARHSLCHNGWLGSYHSLEQPGTEAMRHMPPVLGELGDYLRQCFYNDLPERYQRRAPDLATVQIFDLKRRTKMSYHSDSWPGNGKSMDTEVAQEQGSPVLSVNLFHEFNYWTIPVMRFKDPVEGSNRWRQKLDTDNEDCVTMEDGTAMLWPQKEDHDFQHGVWPVPKRDGGAMEGKRVSIVFRWRWPGAQKRYSLEYPYRVLE
jgi:hypothetical protein